MASSNKSPFSAAHFSAAKHKKKGGPVFYSGGDSNEAGEISVRAHKRRAGGSVPGYASGGRADRHKRGRADAHPFTSAAESLDMGRTTTNVGRSPGGTGAGHPGSHHLAGGHRGHKLSGHHGLKDHPGHHFAAGGAVDRITYAGHGSNVEREAYEHEASGGVPHVPPHPEHGKVVAQELHSIHESGARTVHHRKFGHYGVGGEVAKELVRGAAEKLSETMRSKHRRDEECDPDDDEDDED